MSMTINTTAAEATTRRTSPVGVRFNAASSAFGPVWPDEMSAFAFPAGFEYSKPAGKAKALISSGQTGPNAELAALNRTPTGLVLRVVASAAVVLIVIDMIYKPGA